MSVSIAAEGGYVRKPPPPAEVIAKLPKDGGEEFNRLVFEKSPYLLQHARNPVDWRPWGEEAFAEAERTGKPVLMSIGYTTCHWCHVMEHESFEDPEVAKLMNEWFVCVKVDREERPDVDEVYMTVTQAMTGGGGWPMTVVMTPDKRPFFAGTYFPKEDRGGRLGFKSLMKRLHEAWTEDKDKVEAVASNVKEQLAGFVSGEAGGELGEAHLKQAFEGLAKTYDKERGGFGGAPKFPTPPILSFLLRYHQRSGDAAALEMVETTLREMRLGGMYDQIGFGTHRYSTDADWLVPHFEKMLYDQALLAATNTEAYQVTGNEFYATTAREIFEYVLRDMTSPEGGFFSAEDADSEGEEGVFYTWTRAEVIEVLGEEDGEWFAKLFGFEDGGNWTDEATREKPGSNIPHLDDLVAAGQQGRLEAARSKLFAHREERVHPQKDDKVLTDWNGLMISALARGGQAFGEDRYTAAAKKAADFVLATLRTENGRLLKRYREGEAGLTAHLEDYAFLVCGLIDLYEATFELGYLEKAMELNDSMLEHFWDEDAGGFFMTADDSEKLLVRAKKIYGGAIPSGNAVAALNLLRLSRMTGRVELEERYDALIKAFSGDVAKTPSAFPQLLLAVDFAVGPSYEVVVVGGEGAADVGEMVAALRKPFLPNKVVVFRPDDGGDGIPEVSEFAAYTKTQRSLGGKATAYVCKNFACNLPTVEVAKMLELLKVAN